MEIVGEGKMGNFCIIIREKKNFCGDNDKLYHYKEIYFFIIIINGGGIYL